MALKDFYTDYLNNNQTKKKKPSFIPTNIETGRPKTTPDYVKSAMDNPDVLNYSKPKNDKVGDVMRSQMGNYGVPENEFTYNVNPDTNRNEFFLGGKSIGDYKFNPDDNKTYGDSASITDALKQYATDNAITPARTPLGEGEGLPGIADAKIVTKMYNEIMANKDEKFSYDSTKDEACQAAKGQYEKMGDTAYRNTVGGLSDSTMGYASTSNVAAAAQARNAYNERAAALMPQYRDQRYGEFRDARQDDRDLFSDTYKMYQDEIAQDKWQRLDQDKRLDKKDAKYAAWIEAGKEAEQEAYDRKIYGDEIAYVEKQDQYKKDEDAKDRVIDAAALKHGLDKEVVADILKADKVKRDEFVTDRTFGETVRRNKAGESIQWKNAATSARNAETSAAKAKDTETKETKNESMAGDIVGIREMRTADAVNE